MRLIIIIIGALILGILFVAWGNEDNLKSFLQDQILQISGLILGINIPSVIFLIGNLIRIPGDFSGSIKEIKDNLCFMFVSFIIIFVLSFYNLFEHPFYYFKIDWISSHTASRIVIMTLFFLQIYSLFEIANAMFILASNFQSKKTDCDEQKP